MTNQRQPNSAIGLLIFCLSLCGSSFAWGASSDKTNSTENTSLKSSSGPLYDIGRSLTFQRQTDSLQLSFGTEFAQITTSSASLNGLGFRMGLNYAITRRWAVHASLGIAMGFLTSYGYLYTGIDSSIRFYIFGSGQQVSSLLLKSGHPIISEKPRRMHSLSVSGGLDQLLLSGTSSAYLAAGLAFGVNYEFALFSQPLEVSAKYASLTGNASSITALLIGVSLPLGDL